MRFGTCEGHDCGIIRTMFVLEGSLLPTERIILGIDPGLANTGWGVVRQSGARLQCLAYGCVSTSAHEPLAARLRKIYEQTTAVVQRFKPSCVGIETVWFGQNITQHSQPVRREAQRLLRAEVSRSRWGSFLRVRSNSLWWEREAQISPGPIHGQAGALARKTS